MIFLPNKNTFFHDNIININFWLISIIILCLFNAITQKKSMASLNRKLYHKKIDDSRII
ncbi:MAG: hypothetical protein NEHIOOID_00876 [Holosporales bacterium]